MFKTGYYEELGYNLFYKFEDFKKKYDSLATVSQISLLIGLISNFRFKNGRKIEKVLEIGVYNGVTSLYMLKTGCMISEKYKQYGIDIDTSDFCGNAVFKEADENELKSFVLHKGKTALNISEIISKDEKLDLIFIDGGHSHPHPLIDLVSIIPYIHEETIVCLHDVICYMRPNAWGESFIYEVWSDLKYQNVDKMGNLESLGIIKIPENKEILYKNLLNVAKLPFRAAPWEFDDKYLGLNKKDLELLNENMLKHYDSDFVTDFMGYLNDNFKKYEDEYILRIHETRFYNYLFEQIRVLHKEVNFLRNKINKLDNDKNILKFLQNNKNKRILLWGASLYLEDLLKNNDFSDFNILGIIDSNTKNKKQLESYTIYSPDKIKEINADLIISTVYNSNEIVYDQIKEFLKYNQIDIELAPNLFQ